MKTSMGEIFSKPSVVVGNTTTELLYSFLSSPLTTNTGRWSLLISFIRSGFFNSQISRNEENYFLALSFSRTASSVDISSQDISP